MDENKTEVTNETVMNTLKPTACSTVDKKSFQKKRPPNVDPENSLGIINISDVSDICKFRASNASDLSHQLKQQRTLANSSLERASKVAGIPSKYLRPNLEYSSTCNVNLTNDSTISESDLSKPLPMSSKNTSTPKPSVEPNNFVENNLPRLSLGQSMVRLSHQITNPDVSIDNFVKEFHKTMNGSSKNVDSLLFSPAEEAVSMLVADEMSWRRKNEMPLMENFSQISLQDVTEGQLSVGAFFQQKSNRLSDIRMAVSPVKTRNPVPLIDSYASIAEEAVDEKERKSLSVSAIQRLLATDKTPKTVTSFLLKQGQRQNEDLVDQSSLPVSKDSSYISNYSDNEAMKVLTSNKENIDIGNILQKEGDKPNYSVESDSRPSSSSSSRSICSALTSLPNGKLPIESTKMELIFGCVKVDKCVTQEFLLRNRISKRLCLQMSIAGYDFKIRKDNRQDSEPLSATKVMLHPHESKAIIVSFIPTRIGAAIDELRFTAVDPNLQQTKKQSVKLYGYGGFGKIEILQLTKDITGKFWLSLGRLDNQNVIKNQFVLRNSGNLPCFACITFNPKELFAFTSVSVTPSFFVLIPNEQKEVTITFVPTLEDHQVLQKASSSNTTVVEVGSLLLISGTEVNRGRLKRQCRKCIEKGLEIDPVSKLLQEKIKGEAMPSDVNLFKEAPGSLKEILKLFKRNEVVVTVEQDPEVTLIPQYQDESGLFQSLCQDTTAIRLETTTVLPSCRIEPGSIVLSPPTKVWDNLFLVSESRKLLHFEVVSDPDGLEVVPKTGCINTGETVVFNVSYPHSSPGETNVFKVLVYVEHEVFEATVKIIYIFGQNR
ncbi:hypothetical protein NQ315_006918 [Exocentrus adspersus]|uniref:MSP domain-containing protein n=1 Tax=Exocentrus adspersus TaxID=1586481 RepID=A0AAV8WCA1_9CUCU|nr:hypothetical protein NQ315_006918 [Exocentrus adspersus]